MAIPAVSAAIGIYSGITSRFPLSATEGADWLSNTQPGAVTPQLRIAATVQDLIFFNAAVWFVSRDSEGNVADAIRVHPNRWSIDAEGSVLIDGKPFDQKNLIYIAGLKPQGFLAAGRYTIRHAAALEQTILNRSLTPSPITVIKELHPNEATDEEVTKAQEDFANSRRNPNGGVVIVPYGLEVAPYGGADENNQLLISARMACRTDLANHLNISSAMVDGLTGNSDQYTNALQSKSELLELSLKLFTQPIADRLSQDDVTPPGVKVNFDYSEYEVVTDAKGNLGTSTEGNIDE
ncbi:hypothetical protein BWQ92_18095 [Arthrobacter sp. QXT-31]|nr:hypothetical protein BWQ92_18095 [Arthrobacter sp. QXT-31]